ncbi:hypothetical protein HQ560_15125, partial [bacterium]|nr:hypothetical protein [bacterium]
MSRLVRIAIATGLVCVLAPVLAAEPDRPAVLFGGHWHAGGPGFQTVRALDQGGFAVRTASEYGGLDRHKLTWDETRRFRVLVLVGVGSARADGRLGEVVESNLAMVGRFVEAGGGLLIVPYFCQQFTQLPPQDALAKRFGLTIHWNDFPIDAAPVTATPWRLGYAYTDRVTPGPLSKDVPGLWYPVGARAGGQTHVVPFSVGNPWRVAVAAASSTRTRDLPLDGSNNPAQAAGAGKSAEGFPIAAYRQAGRGHVAVVSMAPQHWLGEVAETTLEGVVTTQGLRGKPTGGRRLLLNAVRWLASGDAAPEVGRVLMTTDPELLRDPAIVRKAAPFKWPETIRLPDAHIRAWPGMVGARTARGGGKGTVAEWAAAARKEGLAWIAFLDDIAVLKQAEFEALKAECAAATTAEFAAIPGFAIDDDVGNHYAYLGMQLPWPRAELRTADGARWTSYDPAESPANPRVPGRLSMTSLIYTHGDAGHKLTALNYRFHDDAAPFSDFFCNWSAFGLISGRDGRQIEDALPDWLEVTASGQGGFPVAVDILTDPAQLAGLARRTVLRLPAARDKTCPVPGYFNEFRLYPDNPTSAYVTDGPAIEAWSHTGPRDYEGALPGDFVLSCLRWRLHIAASSARGLAEVAVYDGTTLFRRWLPGGAERFAIDVDMNHDRQHHLVLVVTDKAGRRAVSQAQWDRNHRLEEFMCGDRNNQL